MNRVLSCLGVLVVVLTLVSGRSALSDDKTAGAKPSEGKSSSAKTARSEKGATVAKEKAAAEKSKKAQPKSRSSKGSEANQEKAEEPESKPARTAQAAKPESEAKAEEKKKSEKPATFTVVREPLKVELNLKGVFEAVDMVPIVLRPKQWKELTVVDAVQHGREVHKGDVLVRLELDKVDDQIADSRKDLELADLSLKQTEENLQVLKDATPLELKIAERNKRIADEDLDRLLKVDLPLYRKMTDFMLKMSQQSLEYQKEELKQLEKMYKADDLTEETEEIVLKRQRDAVEQAEFFYNMAKVRHEEATKLTLPRMEETEKDSTRQQELMYRKTRISLPVALKQQELELARRKVERQRAQKRFNELVADREAMTVKAPVDGIVYYGQYVRGQWMGASSMAEDLRPGGTLARDKVFMTIIHDRPMRIRLDVPEESLQYVKPGLKGTAEPTGYPDVKLGATVQSVDAVPLGGQYVATAEPSLPREADMLMPGMNCTVKFVPYLKKRALVALASAVFTDKLDSEKKYVYLHQEGEKPQKQFVTVGKRSGDRWEILEGLDRGDEILLEEPKADKTSKLKDE